MGNVALTRGASAMRIAALAALATAAIAIAGCGGSQTSAAQTCFRNSLANQGVTKNCNDSTAYDLFHKDPDTRYSVSCTHKEGNEYICDVTGSGTQPLFNGGPGAIHGGFYAVTFDGKSIVYQPGG